MGNKLTNLEVINELRGLGKTITNENTYEAIIRANSSIKDMINKVSDKFSLPNNWLNSDFLHTASYSPKLIQHSQYYKTFCGCLSVRVISSEYLIAMKLKSGRVYKKDMSDIIGILKDHKERGDDLSYEKVDFAIRELYGGWDKIEKESKDFILSALNNIDLEELFYTILDVENKNKNTLLQIQELHPDALNENNIHNYTKPIIIDDINNECER